MEDVREQPRKPHSRHRQQPLYDPPVCDLPRILRRIQLDKLRVPWRPRRLDVDAQHMVKVRQLLLDAILVLVSVFMHLRGHKRVVVPALVKLVRPDGQLAVQRVNRFRPRVRAQRRIVPLLLRPRGRR